MSTETLTNADAVRVNKALKTAVAVPEGGAGVGGIFHLDTFFLPPFASSK